MTGQTAAVFTGRVHGTVQLRHTETGTPVARFWLHHLPRVYDHRARQWTDGALVPVICTVHGAAARHAAETLTDDVHVMATGDLRITPSPHAPGQQQLYLDHARVGIDLTHHVAYIDATLPGVLAGQPPARAAA
ncbi:single-stranded DNA-binding protein (plasmid) [Streptomyces sp. Q6]|uniref:Single-stranded DNA-binding protein n=1 Tax=Streptomyces citrinus TaxID=3118173 RepID=A0ACD5ARH0_9ACTN